MAADLSNRVPARLLSPESPWGLNYDRDFELRLLEEYCRSCQALSQISKLLSIFWLG